VTGQLAGGGETGRTRADDHNLAAAVEIAHVFQLGARRPYRKPRPLQAKCRREGEAREREEEAALMTQESVESAVQDGDGEERRTPTAAHAWQSAASGSAAVATPTSATLAR